MAFKLVKYCLSSYKPTAQLSKIRNIRNISLGSSNLNGNFIEEPPIPEYFIDPDEPLQLKRARLVYQSRKRGMLENGLILGTFASKHLANFTVDQLNVYDRLINLPSNDWDIFYWITLKKPTPPEFESDVLNMLKEHCQNKNKESRYRQPDLY